MLLNPKVNLQNFNEVQENGNTKHTVEFTYVSDATAKAVVEVIKEDGVNLKYRLLPSTEWIEITDSTQAAIERDETNGIVVVKWAENHWCNLSLWVEIGPEGMAEFDRIAEEMNAEAPAG
jgi:hypothetical protein